MITATISVYGVYCNERPKNGKNEKCKFCEYCER